MKTQLTPKQRQVHALLVRGLSNREIAAELGLSICTIKCHLEGLYSRLGVTNRHQVLILHQKSNLLRLAHALRDIVLAFDANELRWAQGATHYGAIGNARTALKETGYGTR
jgi:DNA-binding CsgD family transcriptional regulator